MKNILSCGCSFDPADEKDGYEYVVTSVGGCRKTGDAMSSDPDNLEKQKAFLEVSERHHYEIDSHPEWRFV
jgi:hypothetical protein